MIALIITLLLSADPLDSRLEKGEIVVSAEAVKGSGMPRLSMTAVIDAPPEKVWALIDDCGSYRQSIARIVASKELSRDGGEVDCRLTAGMPFPFDDLTAETHAIHRVESGVRWSRSWTLLKGDYTENTGSWVLTRFREDPSRTRVEYQIHLEPKIAVPDALVQRAQKKGLPDVIVKLRELTVAK